MGYESQIIANANAIQQILTDAVTIKDLKARSVALELNDLCAFQIVATEETVYVTLGDLINKVLISIDYQGKIKIGDYWVDKGVNANPLAFEVGDKIDGWIESNTRYVTGIVLALPFDVDDSTKVGLVHDVTL
jgi:hypothetical protein